MIDDLMLALTRAIDELTRPIDTIKHQAKTVTVGISRSDEGVIDRPLVQAVLAAGAGRLVTHFGGLQHLLTANVEDLLAIADLGNADLPPRVAAGPLGLGDLDRSEAVERPLVPGGGVAGLARLPGHRTVGNQETLTILFSGEQCVRLAHVQPPVRSSPAANPSFPP